MFFLSTGGIFGKFLFKSGGPGSLSAAGIHVAVSGLKWGTVWSISVSVLSVCQFWRMHTAQIIWSIDAGLLRLFCKIAAVRGCLGFMMQLVKN